MSSSADRVPVWLDCDPGHDDAMAIILAGHSKKIELLGISVVAGNQTTEKTANNALRILQVAGMANIDVYCGQESAIMESAILCPEIHGESGLDGAEFPDLQLHPKEGKAVIKMFEQISACPAKVDLIATGPLTNVALLLVLYPEVKEHLRQIVFMGGAMGIGNTHPVAEFNIQTDPEAAKIVCNSGVKVVMVPLEVTHTVLASAAILNRIRSLGTPFSKLIVDLLTFFADTYRDVFEFADPPLHDTLFAVAYVTNPEMFSTRELRVDVECGGEFSRGQTVCDLFGYGMSSNGLPKNVVVCMKVDTVAFWDVLCDAIASANEVSCMNK